MHSKQDWDLSDPQWWLSAIAECVATEGSEFVHLPSGDALTHLLTDGYGAAMQYLAYHELSTEDAARSLFWAKALRKWRLPNLLDVNPTSRARMAFAGYHDRNNEAARMELPLYVEDMRRILHKWLPPLSEYSDICGRFGPGAVREGYMHPQRFCLQTHWLDRGMDPNRPWEHFQCDTSLSQGVCKLCAVPKDWNKDRLITVEPCYQSYIQQAVRKCLLKSIHAGPLKGTAMDLGYIDGQCIQRRLALKASQDGVNATLDLKDASDRITWSAVQAVFPAWVVDMLFLSRSAYFRDEGVVSPQFIFAGMGNATTFVVETLFFSAYVVSFQRAHGLKPWVSVFGDDIVCSSVTAEKMMNEEQSSCFVINRLKSYWGKMNVRESCGIFAYKGEDISVPKVTGYSYNFAGALGAAELHRTCVNSRFVFLRRLASLIAHSGCLPNWPFLVEGFPSIEDWSVTFSTMPQGRWNAQYQRREVLVSVLVPRTVSYPCEDAYVDEDIDEGILGLDLMEEESRYKSERLPPAKVWLDATLAGQLSTTQARVNSLSDNHRSRVVFPKGEFHTVKQWCRTM